MMLGTTNIKLKYKSLCVEMQRMWDLNNTGNNSSQRHSDNTFKEKCGSRTRKTFNRRSTKEAILGTSHILREVLQCEACSRRCVDNRWFKRRTRKKRPVARDTMMKMVIMIKEPLW